MEEKANQIRLPARNILIDNQWDGVRLDRFLKGELGAIPPSAIHRLLRTGQVRLNGGRVAGDARLKAGDQVRIPPVRPATATVNPAPAPPRRLFALIRERILYRDEQLLVVNKPAGLPVHSGSGQSWGVVDLVRGLLQEEGATTTPELGHRLDRDTSGCLLLGLDKPATRFIADIIRQRRVAKEYLVLVQGVPNPATGSINAPLAKGLVRSGERMVVTHSGGDSAVTRYRVMQNFGFCALVAATLETGRTHQIRAHFQHLGHPVAGDEKYGNREFNKTMRSHGLHRMFLHAARLSFPRPDPNKPVAVEAPLDPELRTLLAKLSSHPGVSRT